LEKELIEREEKDLSEFPTIGETVQYLIEEQILEEGYVEKLRKLIVEERKNAK
jgi:hypothetical protein